MFNKTQSKLYKRNILRFVYSFDSKVLNKIMKEFNEILNGIDESDKMKKKMMRQYKLLWHLTGLEPEEYLTIGGLKYSTFWTKLHNVSRWRQNVFQYSINDSSKRKLLDDKVEFNKKFSDLLNREWILSNDNNLRAFCSKHNEILVKPLDGSSGRGIYKIKFNDLSDKEKEETINKLSKENVLI